MTCPRNSIPPGTQTSAVMMEEARLRNRLVDAGWTLVEMPGAEPLWIGLDGTRMDEPEAMEAVMEAVKGEAKGEAEEVLVWPCAAPPVRREDSLGPSSDREGIAPPPST